MLVEGVAVDVIDADVVAFGARLVDLVGDGCPDQAPGWVFGGGGLAADAHDRADALGAGLAALAAEDDRGGTAPRDVGARGVDDVGEVPLLDVGLDELLAELALHEGVGGDHADEAGGGVVVGAGEVEEALGEGDGDGVLTVAGAEAFAVGLVQGLVLDRDVGGVADDGVVGAAEDVAEEVGVFGVVDVLQRVVAGEDLLVAAQVARTGAVQQGIADGELSGERGGVRKPGDARHLHGGEQQTEAGDGDGEGVQVHTGDGVEGALGEISRVGGGLVLLPAGEQALEGAEQKVPRAAGGVDQADRLVAEGLDGGLERAVEDEVFDEVRGLQQGVALAGGFREVLVEVAEEAGVPGVVGEVVDEVAGGGVDLLPEGEQRRGAVGGQPVGEQGVLAGVVEGGEGRGLGEVLEDGDQVVAVGEGGVLLEPPGAVVTGALQGGARSGEAGLGDQAVVFQEAGEDAGEDPGDGGLGDLGLAPDLVGLGGAVSGLGLVVGGLEDAVEIGDVVAALAQVVLELGDQPGEVGEEGAAVDHGAPPAAAARWWFSNQSLGMRAHSPGVITGMACPSTVGMDW